MLVPPETMSSISAAVQMLPLLSARGTATANAGLMSEGAEGNLSL